MLQESIMPIQLSYFAIVLFLLISSAAQNVQILNANSQEEQEYQQDIASADLPAQKSLIIKDIVITGNQQAHQEAILRRLPYKRGDLFDERKSRAAIDNLTSMGLFSQIELEGELAEDNKMILYVNVEEKNAIESFDFTGNKAISHKKLREKLNIEKTATIDKEVADYIARDIKKLYEEEHYHHVKVTPELLFSKNNKDKVRVVFHIKEGPRAYLVRVMFKGNDKLPDRKLRSSIFSRENWILRFTDAAGTYKQDELDKDKHRIERIYRDNGYLMAKVTDTIVRFSSDKKEIAITFNINEGDQFHIDAVKIITDEIMKEEDLLDRLGIEVGDVYSHEKVLNGIERIKAAWGEHGYIFADVYPQVKPDEETKRVSVTFQTDKGSKLYVNRINIVGNQVTRDKVIRRQLDIVEGDLITTQALETSRQFVEYLSFFERGGVDWKIYKIDENTADLELMVQEAKTGNFNFGLNYGSDKENPTPSLKGSLSLSKSNLFGMGYDTGVQVQANRHRIKHAEFHFFNPHIFDSNVSGNIALYHKWDEYEQWYGLKTSPIQRVFGANALLGFRLPKLDRNLEAAFELGVERIRSNQIEVKESVMASDANGMFQRLVGKTFQEGSMAWWALRLIKDVRNHKIYPSEGYRLSLDMKMAPSIINNTFSFIKTEFEASYYTSLIGRDWLVLALHGRVGNVQTIGNNRIIPYRELFHMGGQGTVRGFVWGSIGPAWNFGGGKDAPIGARHAVQFNTELIFPIIPDYSMKAHFFYDAGAGWSPPRDNITTASPIKRDTFDLRHSVGFGLNILRPTPAKVDWGFKLDRKKRDGESPHEFHLSMNYAW